MRRGVAMTLAALLAWIAIDLLVPRRTEFRSFNALEMGRLDGDMWRSYYERKPVRLFWQLTRSLRVQFDAGLWRSFPIGYFAARAAFTFKDGRSREQYALALPDLERYFAAISALSVKPFYAPAAARNELEWWIIRREPARFTTADWERYIAAVTSEVYQLPPERFAAFARLRVEAMVLRDQRGEQITEADWSRIRGLLEQSWSELSGALRLTP